MSMQVVFKMITRVANNQNVTESKNNSINNRIDRAIEFGKILEKKIQSSSGLKISAHAADRLKERNINLSEIDMSNLRTAVEKVRDKGGRDALIIYNDTAYVTSVKNNTIITAIDSKSLKENVFTNIDSAVII